MNPGRERTGEGTRRGTEESTMCKRENEGNGKACLNASPDAENRNGEHRKKRDRAAPGQSEYSDVTQHRSQCYHHCTLNENAYFVVFHRKNLLKMKNKKRSEPVNGADLPREKENRRETLRNFHT